MLNSEMEAVLSRLVRVTELLAEEVGEAAAHRAASGSMTHAENIHARVDRIREAALDLTTTFNMYT